MQDRYSGRLAIYTDGSKSTEGRVTSAFVIPELNVCFKYRISDNLTVFTSELVAIKLSLLWLLEQKSCPALSGDRKVVIYSDSLSSVVALENRSSSTRPNLVREITKLFSTVNIDICLTWVPSHVNIRGNEAADQAAKEALGSEIIDYPVPFEQNEMMEAIEKYVVSVWQEQWTLCETGGFYRNVVPTVSQKVQYINADRSKEVTMTRLRLGHCWLNKCLFNIKRHDTGLCDMCRVDETVEHFLLHCTGSNVVTTVREVSERKNIPLTVPDVLGSISVLDDIHPVLGRVL